MNTTPEWVPPTSPTAWFDQSTESTESTGSTIETSTPAPATDGPAIDDLFDDAGTSQDETADTTPPDGGLADLFSEPTGRSAARERKVRLGETKRTRALSLPTSPEAAPAPSPAETVGAPQVYDIPGRRHSDAERLWPYVERVLVVAGADAEMQVIVEHLELTRDLNLDREQYEHLVSVLRPKLAHAGVAIPDPRDAELVLEMVYDELIGISVLGDVWRDPQITEIMVDRWDRVVVERDGRLLETPIRFADADHGARVARSLAERTSDRSLSKSIPLVNAELPGARVAFAYGPVVRGGLSITMRKFKRLLGLEDLRRLGALDDEMIAFLRDVVRARAGILVSGGTGTGKTTIINLLSSFIPTNERVITIEDAFELQLSNSNVVSLQTKEAASSDDTVSIGLAELLRHTLRMRPDRIIVGEIRESEGARVMLTAATTGHDGTMTTIHASSPDMAINERLVDLVRQGRTSSEDSIRRTIANAFEIVVQVSRGRRGNRYISAISLCDHDMINDNRLVLEPIFTGDDDGTQVTFARVGGVRPDTTLGQKLDDLGALQRWSR